MSVRTTHSEACAMYDSVTGRAFGPVFESEENVDEFLDWLEGDPRGLSADKLDELYQQWLIVGPKA